MIYCLNISKKYNPVKVNEFIKTRTWKNISAIGCIIKIIILNLMFIAHS